MNMEADPRKRQYAMFKTVQYPSPMITIGVGELSGFCTFHEVPAWMLNKWLEEMADHGYKKFMEIWV